MFSITKIKATVLVVSTALLCTTPLVAALRTKAGATRVNARTSTPPSHLHSKASSSRASSSTYSHKPAQPAVVSTSGRQERKGKVQSVSAAKPRFSPKPRVRGQQSIDEARTLEIQQALIREHYLSGEATGEWDQATRDALTRLQSDNHWQTKILPDARALIKLGLGPSQQNLLNPESAAIARSYQSALEKSTVGGSN